VTSRPSSPATPDVPELSAGAFILPNAVIPDHAPLESFSVPGARLFFFFWLAWRWLMGAGSGARGAARGAHAPPRRAQDRRAPALPEHALRARRAPVRRRAEAREEVSGRRVAGGVRRTRGVQWLLVDCLDQCAIMLFTSCGYLPRCGPQVHPYLCRRRYRLGGMSLVSSRSETGSEMSDPHVIARLLRLHLWDASFPFASSCSVLWFLSISAEGA
jgi:hypothetical protein